MSSINGIASAAIKAEERAQKRAVDELERRQARDEVHAAARHYRDARARFEATRDVLVRLEELGHVRAAEDLCDLLDLLERQECLAFRAFASVQASLRMLAGEVVP